MARSLLGIFSPSVSLSLLAFVHTSSLPVSLQWQLRKIQEICPYLEDKNPHMKIILGVPALEKKFPFRLIFVTFQITKGKEKSLNLMREWKNPGHVPRWGGLQYSCPHQQEPVWEDSVYTGCHEGYHQPVSLLSLRAERHFQPDRKDSEPFPSTRSS